MIAHKSLFQSVTVILMIHFYVVSVSQWATESPPLCVLIRVTNFVIFLIPIFPILLFQRRFDEDIIMNEDVTYFFAFS
jgi:hypothetical protein